MAQDMDNARMIPIVPVSPDAIVKAKELVKYYDGGQTDFPVVDVGGFFVLPGSPGVTVPQLVEHLRGVVAKALDRK